MQKIAWNKELLNAQEENLLFPDEPCICINKTKFTTGSQHADIMKQFVLFPFNLNFVNLLVFVFSCITDRII